MSDASRALDDALTNLRRAKSISVAVCDVAMGEAESNDPHLVTFTMGAMEYAATLFDLPAETMGHLEALPGEFLTYFYRASHLTNLFAQVAYAGGEAFAMADEETINILLSIGDAIQVVVDEAERIYAAACKIGQVADDTLAQTVPRPTSAVSGVEAFSALMKRLFDLDNELIREDGLHGDHFPRLAVELQATVAGLLQANPGAEHLRGFFLAMAFILADEASQCGDGMGEATWAHGAKRLVSAPQAPTTKKARAKRAAVAA